MMTVSKPTDPQFALPPSPAVHLGLGALPDDSNVPDNYVEHTLRTTKELPPVTLQNAYTEVNWLNATILFATPLMSLYGLATVPWRWETFLWAVAYYFFTGLGITAGYHRLYAHRSYNASLPLQYILAMMGAGAVQGSIKWWSRAHRAHHRYTDTDLDPYGAHKGLLHSHIGWMLVKPRRRWGQADVSDLSKNAVVRWQHKNYIWLMLFWALVVPCLVAGLGWGDWWGGLYFAGAARLVFVHHSTFCVNSLAHYLGDAPFDDKHTPRDHVLTALVTIGEGYHNFHHQFPMDYRNAIRWYQYDPTKWFIWACKRVGLASHLKVFPDNEVRKGELTMKLKKLRKEQEGLKWPTDSKNLPVVDWESYQLQSLERPLIMIAGFIHDVSDFLDEHPGGKHYLTKFIGKDATTAFFGGVYDHSNAAHNLLAMKRVGVLLGGQPHGSEEKMIPPSQRLRIATYKEMLTTRLGAAKNGDVSDSGYSSAGGLGKKGDDVDGEGEGADD